MATLAERHMQGWPTARDGGLQAARRQDAATGRERALALGAAD
jgi:hypothetical protein